MDENLQEDWFDARLRDEAVYVDDGGFTARVVQKLPARPVRHVLRAVILLGVTLVASIIAYLLSDGGWFIAEEVTRFARLPLPVMWLCAAIATGLVMAGGFAAAMSRTSRRSR
jgi:cytochrome bd-type quinol oxidase subunit 1